MQAPGPGSAAYSQRQCGQCGQCGLLPAPVRAIGCPRLRPAYQPVGMQWPTMYGFVLDTGKVLKVWDPAGTGPFPAEVMASL